MDALAQMGITSRESLHTAMMAMNMIPGQSYRNRDEYLDVNLNSVNIFQFLKLNGKFL